MRGGTSIKNNTSRRSAEKLARFPVSIQKNGTYCFTESERERDNDKLAFTSIFGFPVTFSWRISAFGLKLWLHISMSGSIIGMLMWVPSASSFPYNRKARDETADIAHPRDDESTSWPPKGWSFGFRFSSACLTSFSNSRRKRHLLFTWCDETINIFKCTIYFEGWFRQTIFGSKGMYSLTSPFKEIKSNNTFTKDTGVKVYPPCLPRTSGTFPALTFILLVPTFPYCQSNFMLKIVIHGLEFM